LKNQEWSSYAQTIRAVLSGDINEKDVGHLAYRAYNFPLGEPENTIFEIYLDGKPVKAHEARVSAVPFNRHWPGHQRTLDQTELVPFINFELDAPVSVCVISKKDFKEAVVRPLSRDIKPISKNREIIFTIPGPGQYTLELDGPQEALHLFADPIERYDVNPDDPDTIYFGPGTHSAGVIELKSGQTLFIDEEAIVFGQVQATDAENICICGHGILDHSRAGTNDVNISQAKDVNKELIDPLRPSPMVLSYCRNVEIKDIIIRDPCFLALRPIACEDVTIDNVKIIGCWRYNSDGIDFINSKHCRVKNCFIRSFDDSMCLKGFYFLNQGEMFHQHHAYAEMDDIAFENCVIWNDWSIALQVGPDLCAMEIKNCVFRDCHVIHCNGNAVIDLSNVDYAEVHDILFENIYVEYDDVIQIPTLQESDDQIFQADDKSDFMPYLFLIMIYFSPYSHGGTVRGAIHDITFRNIKVFANRMPPSLVIGYDDTHKVSTVKIENLYLNDEKIMSLADANMEFRKFTEGVAFC
jgi:hypothetical protein